MIVMTHNIGIMQGRLIPPTENRFQSFPRYRWEDEFELAAKAGLDRIEWIHDLYGADVNPISTDAGIEKMKMLSKQHRIQVLSLCADYFMDKPLVRTSSSELEQRISFLEWLLKRCQLAGITRISLPFVDASRIGTEDEMMIVYKALTKAVSVVEQTEVEIHIEASLNPKQFSNLLSKIPHPMFKVNYDSGNSSSLGFHIQDEFEAYGSRIGSVHIKDRQFGAGTVPLGSGDADFVLLAGCLKAVNYQGDFILQAARGPDGGEVDLARQNREFVLKHILDR